MKNLNERLRKQFDLFRTMETLIPYVMSELISPIADYAHAISLICDNFYRLINCRLLIVGAHLYTQWDEAVNGKCLLDALNCMYTHLPNEEKCIVKYLNALEIRKEDPHFATNPQYITYLTDSISSEVPFVYNRLLLAEISCPKKNIKYLIEAKENVKYVASTEEIINYPDEYFLDPMNYIREHILGTFLPESVFRQLFLQSH